MNFDDNALYRHQESGGTARSERRRSAGSGSVASYGLNYIKLDGTVGCMVNGAGLAMATMDIIKYAGGSPANFLDVGGGANAEQMKNAFRILLSDTNVKAVLINIFGGILRCDTLATGVVAAARELDIQGADRGPHGRHQRRTGPEDSAGFRLQFHGRATDMKDAARKGSGTGAQ